MTASNRLFCLKNIGCQRGGRVLFQNLSFGLDTGDVVHLSGPNGSGKTSLLRIMAGALPFDGEILWGAEDFLVNEPEAHAARFAFLPSDDRNLKVLETGEENLSFWARLWGVPNGGVDAALAAMDISGLKDRLVKFYSAGQKRRLSIARVLLKPSVLWLLDEPLNGLDDASAALFKKALDKHIAGGGMAVIASHHPIDPPAGGSLRRIDLSAEGKKAA